MLRDTIHIFQFHNPCDDEIDEGYEESLLERNEDIDEIEETITTKDLQDIDEANDDVADNSKLTKTGALSPSNPKTI